MNEVVLRIEEAMAKSGLQFSSKPILIGGMVMEYYGLRKGKDMDWIITENDYQRLAQQFPEHQKELCGDLGIEIGDFDMWRSFSLFDYSFFKQGSVETEYFRILSIDRLLWMKVYLMEIEKHRKDLDLIQSYFEKRYRNQQYVQHAVSQNILPT